MIAKNRYAVLAGKKLRNLRRKAGYSVLELAQLSGGRSAQQIHRYERGINKIDLDTLVLCLNVLNIHVGDFFEALISEEEL